MRKLPGIPNIILALFGVSVAVLGTREYLDWKKNEKPAITEQTKASQLESAIKSYGDFKDKLPNEQGSTMEGMFKNEEKILTDLLNKAKDVPNYNQVLNTYYNLADIHFSYGDEKFSREQGKQTDFYKKSIEMCDQALKLIKEKKESTYLKDDFLYMRGRANASLGRIEEAVQNYLSALLSLSSKTNEQGDQGIKNMVGKDLGHLLNGKDRKRAEIALQHTFRQYEKPQRQRILEQMHQTGPYSGAYHVLTGRK